VFCLFQYKAVRGQGLAQDKVILNIVLYVHQWSTAHLWCQNIPRAWERNIIVSRVHTNWWSHVRLWIML